MIVSKCPLRVSLVGGGTDLQSFIDYNGYGSVISFPCNLYSYITLFCDKNGLNAIDRKYVIEYIKKEEINSIDDIKNDVARVCLKYFNAPPCKFSFHSDIFSYGSGLASSSAYMIAAVLATKEYLNIEMPYFEVYNLALKLEREFNPLTGSQDIYGCGIGGFKRLEFLNNSRIKVKIFNDSFINDYDKYLIHTGVSRKSTNILNSIDLKKLECLLPLVDELQKSIESNDRNTFFEIINEGWRKKKESSNLIINNENIKWMDSKLTSDKRIKAHKLCGAGGGGYFLVFAEKGFDIKRYLPEFKGNCFKIFVDPFGASSQKI